MSAYNEAGESPESNSILVTTLDEEPVDPGALEAPVALAATNVTSSGFTARWNGVSGAEGYWIEFSNGPTFASPYFTYDEKLGNVTSYVVDWASPATTYYYRVFAHNNEGPIGYSVSD